MNRDLSFEPDTGAICIGDTTCLKAFQEKSVVQALVSPWVRGSRDLQNGYKWLQLGGLTFGNHPAGLSLCFHHGKLIGADWGVSLPGASMEGGWPTQQAIDQEIAFVRQILATLFQREMTTHALEFSWGTVWSEFDPKGFLAAHGMRYRQL